ncbi:hypothetical protein CHUAL_009670 [Chamberlinius hualienensis]
MAQFNQVQVVQLRELMSSLLHSKLDVKFEALLASNSELLSRLGSLDKRMIKFEMVMLGVKQVVSDVKTLKKVIDKINLDMDSYQEGQAELWNMLNCLDDKMCESNLIISINKDIEGSDLAAFISVFLGVIIMFQPNGILRAFKLGKYNGVRLSERSYWLNGFLKFSLRGTDLLCEGRLYKLGLDRETVFLVSLEDLKNGTGSQEGNISGVGKLLSSVANDKLDADGAVLRSRKLSLTPPRFVSIKLQQNESMVDYLNYLTVCSDHLKAARSPIFDKELAFAMLMGLPDDYDHIMFQFIVLDDHWLTSTNMQELLTVKYECHLFKKTESELPNTQPDDELLMTKQ